MPFCLHRIERESPIYRQSVAGRWFRFHHRGWVYTSKLMKEDQSSIRLVLGLLLLVACEAKTPLDSPSGGVAGDSASTSRVGGAAGGSGDPAHLGGSLGSGGSGGIAGTSGPESTAGGAGGARVKGDARLSCSMSASQYDNSCNVDSDCVAVPEGAPCDDDCRSVCPTSALNVRDAYQYLADLKALMAEHNESPVCRCPCYAGPYCCQGICTGQCGGCSLTPQWQ